MNRKVWAFATAIIGLVVAAFFWLETAWWFWPSLEAHRWAIGIGGFVSLAWSLLYFLLKK